MTHQHFATPVLVDLAHRFLAACKAKRTDEANRIVKLGRDLEALYPDAKAELLALHRAAGQDTPTSYG